MKNYTIINYFIILIVLSFIVSCNKESENEILLPIYNNGYILKDGEVIVNRFARTEEVVIPPKVVIDGIEYPVTIIGSQAYNDIVKILYLPSSIRKIEENAFSRSIIEELHIENISNWCNINFEKTYIRSNTVSYVTCESNPINSKTRLYLNNQFIGDELIIPNEVDSITDYAFQNLKIKELSCGQNVKKIGDSAFSNCPLIKIEFGEQIEEIGERAFDGILLKDLKLNEGIRKIGSYCFGKALTTVQLPESLKEMGYKAFMGVENIHIKSIKAWLEIQYFFHPNYFDQGSVYEVAFALPYNLYLGNDELINIIIPEGTEEINDWAFYNSNIQNIHLPTSLLKIGKNSFNNCNELLSVSIPGNICSLNTFNLCGKLQTAILEEGITEFADSFGGCPSLQRIVLPSTLLNCDFTSVFYYNFYNAEDAFTIESSPNVEVKALQPPTLRLVLPKDKKIPETVTLFVPEESLELYKKAIWWRSFPTIEPILFNDNSKN